MALFPTSPSNGQTANVDGIQYTYSSSQTAWVRSGTFVGNAVANTVTASGNITANFFIGNGSQLTGITASVANTVSNNAQPNITSVGTLTSLGVSGNITAANITANTGVFTGNGSGLTSLNASNVSSGTLAQARLANSNVILGNTTLALGTTTTTIAGLSSVTSTSFVGELTGAATTAGTVTTAAQPNITSVGTLTSLGVTGNVTANRLISNIASGTAPLVVTSTTRVANLNVDRANVADLINVTELTTGIVYPVFSNSDQSGVVSESVNESFSANLGNGALIATTFVGTLAGNATRAGTVTTAAQPNITSVGTLTSLGVSGAVTASTLISNVATGTAPLTVTSTTRVANLNVAQANVSDFISVAAGTGNNFLVFANAATGNIAELTSTGLIANLSNNSITATTFVGSLSGAATSATTAGTVTTAAQPNITSVGTLTSLGVSGNITAANITANTGVFTGNGSGLSAITGANVTGAVAFATTANAVAGANVSGTVSSATTAGTVTTAAQPNITSVGTLTSLGVSGTVTAPAFTANTGIFTGNGSGLTALAGANVTGTVANATFATSAGTAGTVTTAAQPNITSVGTLTSLGVNGTVTAVAFTANTGVFTGNGNGLSSIVGANVTGAVAFATTANAVAGANVSGAVAFATTANAVAGANVSGTVSSATTAGTVTTAAQPNITSVGTLTSATVTGNVAAGNLTTTGVLSVTGTGVSSIAGNLDMTGNTITNLATPTNASDAATKQYVDDVAQGLHTHDSCNAATNTTLASISGGTVTYNNGTSGVGATLTTTGSYTTIDGVTLSNGMRILVKDEANTAHNGIYDRTSSTVLTRSDDFNTPTEMAGGDFTFVTAGTLYDNTGWVMPDPVTTVGTSPVVWIQFSGAGTYTAGTGLTLTGSQFSVNVAQPQITSVGTLTGLAVNGNITAANITANTGVFTGNGAALTNLNASNISSGTLAQARLANASVTLGSTALTLGSTVTTVAGLSSVTSTTFVGALTGAATTAGTVTTAAQPNITSVGTLTSLGVSGTVTAPAFTANTGVFTGNGSGLSAIAGANVTGTVASATSATSATTAGTVTTAAQPNITSVGTLSSLGVNGTVTAVAFTANTGVFTGNGSGLSAIAGANVTGTVASATSATSATTAGTVTTASQPNITSVGTLTSLGVSGAVTASTLTSNVATGTAPLTVTSTTRVANLNVAQANVSDLITVAAGTGNNFIVFANAATGNVAEVTSTGLIANLSNNSITATTFVGSLSGAATSATTAGTVTTAAQPNITSVGTLTSLNSSGTITAPAFTANTGVFTGNGSGLSAIAGANVTGTVASATSATSATTAGTVTTAAQPNITSVGTLTSLGVNGTVTAVNFTANTGVFTGNANGLSSLQAGNLVGTVAQARLANSSLTINGTSVSLGGSATITATATNALTIGTGLGGTSYNGSTGVTITNTGVTSIVAGTNIAVSAATGAVTVSVTGTVPTATSATTAGTVTTAAQPNITSVGTLTGLTVSGSASLATSSGNVGVGTASPKSRLQVTGITSLGAPVLGSAANAPLHITNSDPAYGLVAGVNGSTGHVWLQAQRSDGGTAAYNITLNEAGGNVGIGTSSPSARLDVSGDIRVRSNIAYVSPNGANTINSTMLNGGTLAWSGNAGQLFSITDSMTGNIFTVNDVSGIPMISVDAGGNIQMAVSGGFVNYGVTAGITAAGSTQGTATALTRPINVVSTVSASTGVILPTVPAGARIIVMNTSGTALNVYPPTSAAINSAATNVAYSMPAGTRLEFISVSTTQWYTMNATYG